jgi:hypothetical protein
MIFSIKLSATKTIGKQIISEVLHSGKPPYRTYWSERPTLPPDLPYFSKSQILTTSPSESLTQNISKPLTLFWKPYMTRLEMLSFLTSYKNSTVLWNWQIKSFWLRPTTFICSIKKCECKKLNGCLTSKDYY